MRAFGQIRRLLAGLLCLLMVTAAAGAFAEEAQAARIVTIGWYQSDRFQEGMSDDARKSGYCYEYIHKIADYNGWQYRYVYGEWSELLAMLLNGEIDLLAGVSKTAERMEKLLYPNEVMGYENYVLYQDANVMGIDPSDLSSLSGKKLGGVTDNLMTLYLEKWIEENRIDAEIVYYTGFEQRDLDFAEGRLDGIVTTDNAVLTSTGYSQVAKVGSEPYYLAVTGMRPELLSDLNCAVEDMRTVEPYFMQELEYSCYGTTLSNSSLSSTEEEWLEAHSEITIGYLDDYLPYCSTDGNGNVHGLITDVTDAVRKELGITDRLTVRYRGYTSGDEMLAALRSGEIDAAFPVCGDTWQLEQDGIKATNAVVTSTVDLVCRENGGDVPSTIAVSKGNMMMRSYVQRVFPDASIVEAGTTDDCLQAVLNGSADATTINGLRVDIVKQDRRYSGLKLVRLSEEDKRCFGVSAGSTGLHMLLNRGVKLIGQSYANNASYSYMAELYPVTLIDFVLAHLPLFGTVTGLILLVIALLVLNTQRRTKRFLRLEEEKNRQLREQQVELEQASAETEMQLEEIHELNRQLEERRSYTDTLYSRLLRIQSCGILAYRLPSRDILVMNDMAKRLYGLDTEGEVDHDRLWKSIGSVQFDDDTATRARLRRLKRSGDMCQYTFKILHEDGTTVQVYTVTQLYRMENGEMIVLSSLQDISEITDIRLSADRAAAANEAKTSFLFNMSHDIRTPMNAIIGYAELMEKHEGETERCRDYLRKIRSASSFLLSLINNVLEMARIESGRMALDETPCEPKTIFTEIGSVYSELMRTKGIRFTMEQAVRTPWVMSDAVKIRQVMLNLLSNAYKYTPGGGAVTFSVREKPGDREGYVVLETTVADTGIGMSGEYLPRLFEEFTRAQTVTENGIEGTGLGMPIVKRLVDLMGGTIEVESELGKGTTFVVSLPHRIAEAQVHAENRDEVADISGLKGRRVLLAEDNELNAEIATEILSDLGVSAERAADGIECVNMLSKAPAGYYDLVLMDIQMPNLDGYGAARRIRAMSDRAKAGIPIIAMTANAFDSDREDALRAGMNAHLPKPIEIARLVRVLTEYIR